MGGARWRLVAQRIGYIYIYIYIYIWDVFDHGPWFMEHGYIYIYISNALRAVPATVPVCAWIPKTIKIMFLFYAFMCPKTINIVSKWG